MKILVLGATGMLGSTLFKYFHNFDFDVFGTVRSTVITEQFLLNLKDKIITEVNGKDLKSIENAYQRVMPDVVINCIGVIKQIDEGNNPLEAIPINSLLPHFLANLCKTYNSRLINFGTDCVFSGKKGNYIELDIPDATDIYGRTKLLGEVNYAPAITLRTSIIGHELAGNKSLISWFLSQENHIKGFKSAIYSGFPTIEIANIIKMLITKHKHLTGLYHVASDPISKYDLLCLVKKIYNKNITIEPSYEFKIDRTLDAYLFNKLTQYKPPNWETLIKKMHDFEQGKYENV